MTKAFDQLKASGYKQVMDEKQEEDFSQWIQQILSIQIDKRLLFRRSKEESGSKSKSSTIDFQRLLPLLGVYKIENIAEPEVEIEIKKAPDNTKTQL